MRCPPSEARPQAYSGSPNRDPVVPSDSDNEQRKADDRTALLPPKHPQRHGEAPHTPYRQEPERFALGEDGRAVEHDVA